MQSLLCLLVVVSVVLGEEMISDPGFQTVESNHCGSDRAWWFRTDFVFNATSEFFDSQCIFSGEYPTPFQPGLTSGNRTNINKVPIPALPTITDTDDLLYAASAGVVDMNTGCRAAVWTPFTLENNAMEVVISFKLWASSTSGITQLLLDDSAVHDAEFLQYQQAPEGLLVTAPGFPPVEERTNVIRIDVMNSGLDFWDRAFAVTDDDIYMNIPVDGWTNGMEVPTGGTNRVWVPMRWESPLTADGGFGDAGTYAIRFASAQSKVGVTWGISDVHITAEGGTDPTPPPEPIIYDVVVRNSRKTIGGTATYSKLD